MTKLAATNQGVSERTRQLEREARQLEHERGQSFVYICFLRCCACFTRRAAELFPHKLNIIDVANEFASRNSTRLNTFGTFL